MFRHSFLLFLLLVFAVNTLKSQLISDKLAIPATYNKYVAINSFNANYLTRNNKKFENKIFGNSGVHFFGTNNYINIEYSMLFNPTFVYAKSSLYFLNNFESVLFQHKLPLTPPFSLIKSVEAGIGYNNKNKYIFNTGFGKEWWGKNNKADYFTFGLEFPD